MKIRWLHCPNHHTHNQREESSFKNPNKHQQRMRKTIKIYNSLNVNIAIFLFILCSAGKNSSVKVNAGAPYCWMQLVEKHFGSSVDPMVQNQSITT